MIACTAKWSSMTFSLTAPVPETPAKAGKKEVAGTSFLPRGPKVGGDW